MKNQRTIKSYVKRKGRITASQRNAFENLWHKYGLNLEDGLIDYTQVFGNNNKVILEIGFGMGQSLFSQAKQNQDVNFIGVEVHEAGVGALLKKVEEENLHNIKVYAADAILVLQQAIKDQSLDVVQLFFPDPWHKKKHHKRRIVQKEFLDLVHQKLTSDGVFHAATDWQNYAEHILEQLEMHFGFTNKFDKNNYATQMARPTTKFEVRGKKLGHGVWDVIFLKVG